MLRLLRSKSATAVDRSFSINFIHVKDGLLIFLVCSRLSLRAIFAGVSFFSRIRWPSQLSRLLLIVVLHDSDPVFLYSQWKKRKNHKNPNNATEFVPHSDSCLLRSIERLFKNNAIHGSFSWFWRISVFLELQICNEPPSNRLSPLCQLEEDILEDCYRMVLI